jgi:hypothetical protein
MGKLVYGAWISLLVSTILLPSALTDLYQPGQRVGDYHMAITTDIHVNSMTTRLDGNSK